jgi:membrane-bound inhibitor of C-type lysozyme
MKKIIISFLMLVIIAAVFITLYVSKNSEGSSLTSPPIAQADYICNEDKTMQAAFYKGEPKPVEPGQPPIPTGSVKVSLSDGRKYELPQTLSADGSRYATPDESFVFWSKGNGALVLEKNIEKSYIGCLVVSSDPGGLPKVYHDGTTGFSVRYPDGYSLNTSYKYQGLGPGKEISGVKFIIPSSLATGTNLSSFDTGVSLEIIPAVQDCNAGLFLSQAKIQTVTDNDMEYSFASSTQGAAGNFYEEDVWAMPGTNPCFAVRYLIHSTNISNYPSGTVSEFNREALIEQFDKIRHSLISL